MPSRQARRSHRSHRRHVCSRCRRSHSRRRSVSRKSQGKYGIWGKYGAVYNPKARRYTRIGGSKSIAIIVNELPRNAEWRKRVNYMIEKGGHVSEDLRVALQK